MCHIAPSLPTEHTSPSAPHGGARAPSLDGSGAQGDDGEVDPSAKRLDTRGVDARRVTDRRRRDDGETSLWQPSAPGSERCWRPVMGAMVFNSSRRRSGLWSVVERRPSAA
jgi:hypothetical protein